MITCKEDLINTYVDGRDVELGNAYQELLFSFGVKWLDFNDQLVRVVGDSSLISRFCFNGSELSWDSKEVAIRNFGKELTLEDLKPQTKEVEWDGEYQLEGGSGWFKYKSTYVASNGDMFAMCLVPNANKGLPFEQYLDVATTKFRKPETPEQKLERDELEAAYDLYCDLAYVNGATSFDAFKTDAGLTRFWLSVVRKTNYKVDGE
ncbi:putative coil containing protein [Vibrio phage 381E49-1]|nr:putative coil containing protein [Vibrio phage 381E49-1]